MARQDSCPLCGAPGPFERVPDIRKRWHRWCARCGLLFVEDAFLPTAEDEKTRYAKHRNGPHDAGYVAFLRQALEAARPHLRPGMRGLDYGCGHTPTLCGLLEAEGFSCENYDPFFHPRRPEGPFDFVLATEVVEHFHHPGEEWAKLAAGVDSGGWLIVMTAPWEDLEHFRTWGYASDETHVCFYRPETMSWAGRALGFEIHDSGNPRVFVLRRTRA